VSLGGQKQEATTEGQEEKKKQMVMTINKFFYGEALIYIGIIVV
jgi:hypothetical protein